MLYNMMNKNRTLKPIEIFSRYGWRREIRTKNTSQRFFTVTIWKALEIGATRYEAAVRRWWRSLRLRPRRILKSREIVRLSSGNGFQVTAVVVDRKMSTFRIRKAQIKAVEQVVVGIVVDAFRDHPIAVSSPSQEATETWREAKLGARRISR